MIGFDFGSSKKYHYQSVSYTPCPVCLNNSYYIFEITSRKQGNYFSLSCKKCSSEIFYSDISHIVNNYKVMDEHQYRKHANRIFSYVFFVLLVSVIGYTVYHYGNEHYQRYNKFLAYNIDNKPSLDKLCVDDFLVMKHPEPEENGHIMVKIVEVNNQHILVQLSRHIYVKKQDLVDVIIYKNYGKKESELSDKTYKISKTDFNEFFINNAILLHKKSGEK